uniref:diacylglycerol/lipid kinase family protein n=1 Tax=uncultured Sphingomonas sp. TaxID=158754 RepID=UPI0035CC7E4C
MARPTLADRPDLRVGVISNGKAHRNLTRGAAPPSYLPLASWTAPATHTELSDALAGFAARDVNVLVVDGGDGTVRDVITEGLRHFPRAFPTMVVVPSGKTNALALDLGIPSDWTIAAALDSIGAGRVKQRNPLEIWRDGASAPDLRGFLFGAGAFVRATGLAQRVHRLGAFDGMAVGLSLASAIAQTFFGGKRNPWRQGEPMRIETADGHNAERAFYIALASTLNRLPLGIKPFGRKRDGLKLLGIDAPPRRMLAAVPALLAGSEAAWLDRAGYHRATADSLHLSLAGGFILDGEFYPGGGLLLKKGAALTFATP